jgi:hypothetical protein
VGFLEQHVEIAQRPLLIASFAVSEIKLPKPDKGVRVAQIFDFWNIIEKTLAPGS